MDTYHDFWMFCALYSSMYIHANSFLNPCSCVTAPLGFSRALYWGKDACGSNSMSVQFAAGWSRTSAWLDIKVLGWPAEVAAGNHPSQCPAPESLQKDRRNTAGKVSTIGNWQIICQSNSMWKLLLKSGLKPEICHWNKTECELIDMQRADFNCSGLVTANNLRLVEFSLPEMVEWRKIFSIPPTKIGFQTLFTIGNLRAQS